MPIMCHHERGSKDIFRPHTEAFDCRRCAFSIPWTAGVNIFSGERESGLRDEHVAMRVARGDAMVTMRVYFAREKNELRINTVPATAFSCFSHMYVQAFRIWPPLDQKSDFCTLFLHFNLRSDFKS
jgi:hypothetical protein